MSAAPGTPSTTDRHAWLVGGLLWGLLAACLAGCQTTPTAVIPDPLPEALAWTLPTTGGAFLGLDTEENIGDSLDDLSFAGGVQVVRVVANSPAARAGVQAGDIVLSLDDEQVFDPAALDALVTRHAAGEPVTLQVQRGDTVFDVPVTLVGSSGATVGDVRPRWRKDPARSRAGWATTVQGALLVSAADDSPFPRAGLGVGSVVLAVDGEPVHSDRELIRKLTALEPGARITVDALDADGELREVRVRLQAQPEMVTEFGLVVLLDYTATTDGQTTTFSLLDLWFFELFRYERDGNERRWSLLEIFGFEPLTFASGIGELTE